MTSMSLKKSRPAMVKSKRNLTGMETKTLLRAANTKMRKTKISRGPTT